VSIQPLAVVADTLRHELDLAPEILDRDPGSTNLGFQPVEALVDLSKVSRVFLSQSLNLLCGSFTNNLNLLSGFLKALVNLAETLVDSLEAFVYFVKAPVDLIKALINRGKPLIEVLEEILVHRLVFPVSATLPQTRAEGNT
jgi:hypothetical protein